MQGQECAGQDCAQYCRFLFSHIEELVGGKRNYSAIDERKQVEVTSLATRHVDHVAWEMKGEHLFGAVKIVRHKLRRAFSEKDQLIASPFKGDLFAAGNLLKDSYLR